MLARCGLETRYHRFHAPLRSFPELYLTEALAGPAEHTALIAEHSGAVVALASCRVIAAGSAELAVLVEDRWQRHGLGSRLLALLIADADRGGLRVLRASVLAEQVWVLRLLRGGGRCETSMTRGVFSVTLHRQPGQAGGPDGRRQPMEQHGAGQWFAGLSTAHLADACLRMRIPVRCGPAGLRPVLAGSRVAGRALPARHTGSVDVFLEAICAASPGDVLVAGNDGRLDEACVGDLVALEAQAAGLAGIVIWGLHRDTADIRAIGLPVFSLGAIPAGPAGPGRRQPDALVSVPFGGGEVTRADLIAADDDGVIVVPAARAADITAAAARIRDTEQRQARAVRAGLPLGSQLRLREYLARREQSPSLTFREHLRSIGGAVEE